MDSITYPAIELLKQYPQWVVWRREIREGKPTKVPYRADGKGMASTTDSKTWATYVDAMATFNRGGYDGIGLVFTLNINLTGIDLDHCRDPQTGIIDPWAMEIVKRLDSYTEITPSGTGVRVIIKAKLPSGGNKKTGMGGKPEASFECYDHARYFTVTGNHLEGTPTTIEERQQQIIELHKNIFPPKAESKPKSAAQPNNLDDAELISKAMAAANGQKFTALWNGDTSAHNGDDSAADLALNQHLAFWTGKDAVRMDSLFRQSGLYREKWERQDYRERTIAKAIENTTDTYSSRLVNSTNQYEPAVDTDLPIIKVGNRQLRDLTADGLKALEGANEPKPILFRFGTGLARIGHDDRNHPFTEQMNETVLRYHLSHAATFERYDAEGKSHDTKPPQELCQNILVASGDWRFSSLSGIVEAPTLRPDFTVISTQGYDAQTGLYYEPIRGLEIPPIPEQPTDSELQDAISLIQEPIIDFLFVNKASYANVLAAMLLSCVRDAITGPVPLTLITKPQPGCGGSLIVDCQSIIATGRSARVVQVPRDPEEMRKLLTTMLISGERNITFDNVDRTLESEYLASFLTTMWWKDRLLGQSTPIELPNRTVVFANGNNAHVGGNLARRIVPVQLDSPGAKVFLRDTQVFKHPQLREWVSENRGQIIASVLTVVRGWVNAGKPTASQLITLGSFESYCQIVGSLLAFMGFKDFLGNLEELYTKIDTDTPAWANFLAAWLTELGQEPTTVAELVAKLKDNANLRAALPDDVADWENKDGIAKGYTRRLGNHLSKREGQKFDNGLTLTRGGEFRNAIRWKVAEWCEFTNVTHTVLVSNVSYESSKVPLTREKKERSNTKKCIGLDLNSQNSQSSLDLSVGLNSHETNPSQNTTALPPPPNHQCPNCKKDVAWAVSPSGSHYVCSSCGYEHREDCGICFKEGRK